MIVNAVVGREAIGYTGVVTADELFEKAKETTRLHLGGWARERMRPSAVFFWRCRVTAMLGRALALRGIEVTR